MAEGVGVVTHLRRVVADFIAEVGRATCEAHRERGGQHVPYHGDFRAAPSSCLRALERWADLMRSATSNEGDPDPDAFKATHRFILLDGTPVAVVLEQRGDWIALEADGTRWYTVMSPTEIWWTCTARGVSKISRVEAI